MNDAASPAAVLVDTFAEIHRTRMQGMPFVNEALAVEAVGFAPWGHHWLGVLITPWFMSLMLLPRIREHWQAIPPGDSLSYTFPAGVFDFIAASDARIGEYQACSLFSPVFELADQETARLAAEAARAALFDAANRDVLVPEPIRAPAPMTKRDFLHLPGTDREPGR